MSKKIGSIRDQAVPLDPKPRQDRVTATVNIYHEHVGDQPLGVQGVYTRFSEVSEEAYITRRMKLTSEWTKLDLGHFKDCPQNIGLFCIENQTGRDALLRPTLEQLRLLEGSVIEVSTTSGKDYWIVPPGGMVFPMFHSDITIVEVRAPVEGTKMKLCLFPR